MAGAARLRVAARLGLDAVGRLLARSLPETITHRSGGSWSSPRRSDPPGYPCVPDAHEFSDAGTADAARKKHMKAGKVVE